MSQRVTKIGKHRGSFTDYFVVVPTAQALWRVYTVKIQHVKSRANIPK